MAAEFKSLNAGLKVAFILLSNETRRENWALSPESPTDTGLSEAYMQTI